MRNPMEFDVTTGHGMAGFNGVMASKSYIEGYCMSSADTEMLAKFQGKIPDATKYPHAYRWYIHIIALSPPPAAAAVTDAPPTRPQPTTVENSDAVEDQDVDDDDDDDDFDVFGGNGGGDDDDVAAAADGKDEPTKESRTEMLARLKKEAEDRLAQKQDQQRTLVAIEIKPWEVEQDLMALWKKITTTIQQPGLKWGDNCKLVPVAFGIQKIQCTFVMGVNNSSDDVVDAILALEDEVQSCEVASMNVL